MLSFTIIRMGLVVMDPAQNPLRYHPNHLICQRVQVVYFQPWLASTLSALSGWRANSFGWLAALRSSFLGENCRHSKANWGAIVSEKYLGVQYLSSGQQRRTGGLASHRIRSGVQIIHISICVWKHAIPKRNAVRRLRYRYKYRYSCSPQKKNSFPAAENSVVLR